ncbi:MAG: hypothetical protein LBP96_06090 [Bacteroidales bacterium]|jgi:hypothetical protein|nr:hypothetical protein [Bacteroidales bacterium]
MKKILTLVAAIAFTATAFTQVGFQFGGNVSTFGGLGEATGKSYKPGYQVGFTQNWGNWGERLSIEPGIFLINKGGKSGDRKTNLNYLQVPLNTKVNFYLGDTRISLAYGIYGACGLWGGTKDGSDKKKEIKFGKDEPYVRFDVGGQVFAGIMAGRVGMNVMYQFGGRKIMHSASATNTSIMLNLTYLLSDSM